MTQVSQFDDSQSVLPEVVEELQEAFNLLNTGNKEYLDHKELKAAMRAFGIEVNHQDIRDIFQDFEKDLEGDGFTFEEFREVMVPKMNQRDSRIEISRLFSILDSENTGYLTFDSLKKIANDIHENISDEDLSEIIEEADTDQDGALSFQEFYNVMVVREGMYLDQGGLSKLC